MQPHVPVMLTCLSWFQCVLWKASCVFCFVRAFVLFKKPSLEGISVVAFFGGELFLPLSIIIQFVSRDPS